MRWHLVQALAVLVTAGCTPAPDVPVTPREEQPKAAVWLVDSVPAGDLVHASDTEADLRLRLGNANVERDTVWLPEGAFTIGTVLYPDDRRRRLEIVWSDTAARARPTHLRVTNDSSAWQVMPGIGIGTPLADLERLNGKGFTLLGFGWDYAGTVSSWQGGRLERLLGEVVLLRLAPAPNPPAALARQVRGDVAYPSAHPAMQALGPRVYEILVRPR